MKSVYDLKLHEVIALEDGTEVRRVPGGWIYTRLQLNQVLSPSGDLIENYLPTSVFIPMPEYMQSAWLRGERE